MPRKPTVVLGQQKYNLPQFGPHAVVTIDYDANRPPPFFQPGPGVVIVGEHQCGPVAAPTYVRQPSVRRSPAEPIRNFTVSEDPNDPDYNPAYAAHRAKLLAGLELTASGQEPAPPDFSPRVITNSDLGNEFADKIRNETGIDIGTMPDPAALVAAAK